MSIPEVTTYAQALTAQASDEILAQLFADMATLGVDVAGFDAFSVQMALPQLQARAEAALQAIRVLIVQGGNPATAALAGDDWLDAALLGWFQEARLGNTFAQQTLTLTAAAGVGPTPFQPGDLIAQDENGTTYVNVAKGKVPKGGTTTALFVAQVAGTAGNAGTGTIDHLVVSPAGLSVTNAPGSIVLAGTDKESNAAYLLRCLGKWGTLAAGGNTVAYNFLIPKAAPTATRFYVRDDNPFGPGTIGVCLANAAGPASTDEQTAVAALLQPKKPLGSGGLFVFPAVAHPLTVSGLILTDGSNPNAAAQANLALQALGATYSIGSAAVIKVYVDRIIATIMSVPGVINIQRDGILGLSPSADVVLSIYEVLTLTAAVTM